MIEDKQWLRAHVSSLTDIHESGFTPPWKINDAPEEYLQAMLNGIVGIELTIRRLEGKWKLSQNRSEKDRDGVTAGLGELETPAPRHESAHGKELVLRIRRTVR